MAKRRKRSPLKIAKDRAWSAFSRWVRIKSGGKCFTCENFQPWKEMNASHFIHGKLDFDEMNINACCVRCNKWLSGNLGEYAIRLIKKYGLKAVDDLKLRASRAVVEKRTVEEYLEIERKYK